MGNVDLDAMRLKVGGRLRELRKERGMSIRAVAKESGLSSNALSMIERGRSSPSVSTLYKVARAMKVPITTFFKEKQSGREIVFKKSQNRSKVSFTRGVWEGLGGEEFTGRVEPFVITLESGANSGRYRMYHSGHEFVLCLGGELEYEVADQLFILGAGDSLLFAAKMGHRWRNVGKSTVKVLIIISGYGEEEKPAELHKSHGKDNEDKE